MREGRRAKRRTIEARELRTHEARNNMPPTEAPRLSPSPSTAENVRSFFYCRSLPRSCATTEKRRRRTDIHLASESKKRRKRRISLPDNARGGGGASTKSRNGGAPFEEYEYSIALPHSRHSTAAATSARRTTQHLCCVLCGIGRKHGRMDA